MKKIKYILLLIITALNSCQDVLDKEPLGVISDATLWNDQVLVDSYLATCYDEMRFIADVSYGSYNDPGRNWLNLPFHLTISDEALSGFSWYGSGLRGPRSGNYTTTVSVNNRYGEWWGYEVIRSLNVFIESMATSPLSASYVTKRTAEARFLRAFAYFNLVKRYGGVPLITISQKIDDKYEELYRKRDNEADIYDFIISEAEAIKNDLSDAQYDNGRPTKYAALALESRAALYAASIAKYGAIQLNGVVGLPNARANEYWSKSLNASQEIIGSDNFALYNKFPDKVKNYRNIFLDEGNIETIFSEQYIGGIGYKSNAWDFDFAVLGYHPWGTYVGGSCLPYLEFVESYENVDGSPGTIDRSKIASGYLWKPEEIFKDKDPRFKATIMTQGSLWAKDTLQFYNGIIQPDGTITNDAYMGIPGRGKSSYSLQVQTGFTLLKYMNESNVVCKDHWSGSTDWIVFRYAEILLNFAEAAFELNRSAEALDAINQIRARAGIMPLASISLDLIRHERKIELAFESHRYWDTRRWRIAVNQLSGPKSQLLYLLDYNTRKFKLEINSKADGSVDPVFLERNYYLPIGLTRIQNNPNLVENPGY